jgi:hypothetical protein
VASSTSASQAAISSRESAAASCLADLDMITP